MVTVRNAKSKGSQFEYDCQASLQQVYKDVRLTKELGFQMQYDIKIQLRGAPYEYYIIECKRHAKFSWNKLVKLYKKLKEKTPIALDYFLLFKPNRQPCLVFYYNGKYNISTFEDYFKVPFIKHKSTRAKK